MEIILIPPVAFLIYLGLGGLLSYVGRQMAGPTEESEAKSGIYAGGEASPTRPAAPGYRPFFVVALFFAVLHLGVLILGSGSATPLAAVYLVGLALALVALILG